MTPGRYFPVGHHVDGHHLSDYLEEADYSPLDAGQRDNDHQRDDQQGNTSQELQYDPQQEGNSVQQSLSDDITCVQPLNTSAASADPTPEIVNTSQPDQQNRVGGPFNTVRYERSDALKQVSFNTTRANPLLHQSSFTKTLVERLYSSVLLT